MKKIAQSLNCIKLHEDCIRALLLSYIRLTCNTIN